MQRIQRKFGTLLKRSDDEADITAILAEFQTADKLLDSFLDSAKAFQTAWKEVLAKQTEVASSLETLYKPIDVPEDAKIESGTRRGNTPQSYLTKIGDFKNINVELQADLQQEVEWIQTKLFYPAMEAKEATKPLKKTIKAREGYKLDFERYQSRADHARQKAAKSVRDESVLVKSEDELLQATLTYNAADDVLRRSIPPFVDGILRLLPLLMTNHIMIQHALVGQQYTILRSFCETHQFPTATPSAEEVVATWDREFTTFRLELEGTLQTLAQGRAVQMPMETPVEEKAKGFAFRGIGVPKVPFPRRTSSGTNVTQVTGLNRAGTPPRTGREEAAVVEGDETPPPRPARPSNKPRISSFGSFAGQDQTPLYEEAAPAKPPRPAVKPRSGSSVSISSYGRSPATPTQLNSPGGFGAIREDHHMRNDSRDSLRSTSSTPFMTPVSSVGGAGGDYFTRHRAPSTASIASSITGKKKPPPPPPAKRIPSSQTFTYCTALYDFAGQGETDLSFSEGDQIRIVKKSESTDDWWLGELKGVSGSFPANYVRL